MDSDDEDGVVITTDLVAGKAADLEVTASTAGLLDAWIDWNGDGDWNDPGEQILTSQPLAAGVNELVMAVPEGALPGETFGRFRLSSTGGLAPTGFAVDGEVEDHAVTVSAEIFTDDFESSGLSSWTSTTGEPP